MKDAGRYKTAGLPEAQFEPGSRKLVLKNLLGIKHRREMDRAEAEALQIAIDKFLASFQEGCWCYTNTFNR